MLTTVSGLVDKKGLSSPHFRSTFSWLFVRSFIGAFGMMNVMLPEYIYDVYWVIGIGALVGYMRLAFQRNLPLRLFLVCFLFVFLNFLVVVDINITFTHAQGRYMFPDLAAIAFIVSIGLESLAKWPKHLSVIILIILFFQC